MIKDISKMIKEKRRGGEEERRAGKKKEKGKKEQTPPTPQAQAREILPLVGRKNKKGKRKKNIKDFIS